MKRSTFFLSAVLSGPLLWSQTTNTTPPTPAATTPSAPSSTSASGLKPRGPEAVALQTPDKVVATIGGKPVTAKQAVDLMKPLRPEDRKRYEANLAALVQQIYMETQLAGEAANMKLDQQSPWKEQLDIARANILTQAYLAKMSEGGAQAQDPKAYYDAHMADFDQVKLSGILVAFNMPGTPAGSTKVQRTEPQAQEKAADLAKKIKAGGDFSALARTDSDNSQSSARGGELGTFVMADANLPPDVKDVIAKMQPGQVSEPVRIPGGYYIFKLDNRTKLPFEQVQAGIVQKMQQEKMQSVLKSETEKYKIQVQDPDFFGSSTPAPSRIPSLQRPNSNSNAPAPPPPGQPK